MKDTGDRDAVGWCEVPCTFVTPQETKVEDECR